MTRGLPREGQQIAHDIATAPALPLDDPQRLGRSAVGCLRSRLKRLLAKARVCQNSKQGVVYFVRHRRRQFPERGHLLARFKCSGQPHGHCVERSDQFPQFIVGPCRQPVAKIACGDAVRARAQRPYGPVHEDPNEGRTDKAGEDNCGRARPYQKSTLQRRLGIDRVQPELGVDDAEHPLRRRMSVAGGLRT